MPLSKGKSQATISGNIRELYHANDSKDATHKRSRKQIQAIAMSVSGKSYKKSKKKY